MTQASRSIVLVTVSGRDAPGITSGLTGILARGRVTILDIGQAVIHGLLSLSILFELPQTPGTKTESEKPQLQDLLKDLLFKAHELELRLEFRVIDSADQAEKEAGPLTPKAYRYALTLIAPQVSAEALHRVTHVLAKHRTNIDEIERLSEGEFGCVELLVSSHEEIDRGAMKKQLLRIANQQGVDIALQAEGLYRRAKRLVAFDMDSTLIQNEVIDEFARELGVFDEIAAVTHAAMRGAMDFDESLRARVAKLRGLTLEQIERVYAKIELTPGAEDLIRVLGKLGYKTALISGGFECIAERVRARLGIDFAHANQLEIENGRATGRVLPPIVNAERKAELLRQIAATQGIALDQVIAIGDGANDIPMLECAGLGIAFNAKPAVRQRADLAMNTKSLRSVLYLLGISGRDLSEVLSY
jgi:phosphoserine phosphatase